MTGSSQRRARLCVLDPEDQRRHVHPLPVQRQHLPQAHAGEEAEPERVAHAGRADRLLDALLPARQHLGRGGDLAPPAAVIPAAAGEPQIDRVAQPLKVDAGAAVERAQQRDCPVGRRPAGVLRQPVEQRLHVAPGNPVQRTLVPVGEIARELPAVEPVGPGRPVGTGGHEVVEGLLQRRHAARFRALSRRVLAAGRFGQDLASFAPGVGHRDRAVSADHRAPVGRLPAAVARAVVDNEGLEAGRLHPHTEAGQPVVPGDEGARGRLQRLDAAHGQGQPVLRHPLAAGLRHSAASARSAAPFISNSIRSAISCAGPRSWPMVQSAA